MASSGWLNEIELARTGNVGQYPVIGNVRIDSISHTGDSLRVQGMVALGIRGGQSGSYAYWNGGVWVDAGNGWAQILAPAERIYMNSDRYASFDIIVTVPAAQTFWDMPVSFRACQQPACTSTFWNVTKYWRLDFSSGGTAPSGLTPIFNSSTWNSVNSTTRISSWGGATPNRLEGIIVTGSSDADFANITSDNWVTKGRHVYQKATSATSETFNMTNNNITYDFNGPIDLKGMLRYYLACFAANSVGGVGSIDMTVRYLPPAPSSISYIDLGGHGAKDYRVNFAGISVNNNPNYDTTQLTRTVRYRIGNGQWTYVVTDEQWAIDANTQFVIQVPAGKNAVVEGWQTYRGLQSEISTVTISNNNSPVYLYGSANNLSEKVIRMYGRVPGIGNVVATDVDGFFDSIDTSVFASRANSVLSEYFEQGFEIDSVKISNSMVRFDASIKLVKDAQEVVYVLGEQLTIINVQSVFTPWGIVINLLPDPAVDESIMGISGDYYVSKKIIKLYGSKNGVTRKVFEDV